MSKQNKQTNSINPVIAGITGAVIGAGVAIAGTVMLEDEKNRKKIKKALNDVKEEAMDYVDNIEKTNPKKEIKTKAVKIKKEVKKK